MILAGYFRKADTSGFEIASLRPQRPFGGGYKTNTPRWPSVRTPTAGVAWKESKKEKILKRIRPVVRLLCCARKDRLVVGTKRIRCWLSVNLPSLSLWLIRRYVRFGRSMYLGGFGFAAIRAHLLYNETGEHFPGH